MPTVNPSTLTWDAPQTNTDGTQLTDLKEYRVYVGTSPSGPWTQVAVIVAPDANPIAGATAASLLSTWGTLASPGNYYTTVVAVDTSLNVGPVAIPVPFVLGDAVAPSSPLNLRLS
jgi:hypothetical protein